MMSFPKCNSRQKIRIIFVLFVCLSLVQISRAQQSSKGFILQAGDSLDKLMQTKGLLYHSAFQPLNPLLRTEYDTIEAKGALSRRLSFQPLMDVAPGVNDAGKFTGFLSGGAALEFTDKKRWDVSLGYMVFYTQPPAFIDSFATVNNTLPGVGKLQNASSNGMLAHNPFGRVLYKFGKRFTLEAGRGKHFWGDGFRSLILSENAPAYPYISPTLDIWRFRFKAVYAQLDQGGEKKYFATHGLSLNAGKRLQFSFYEMVVWQARDSLNNRNLDIHYLNPFIFYRPVEFAQGSADNVLLGFGFKWKARRALQIYGQFVLDEFLLDQIQARSGWWANKFGGQIGYKLIDLKGLSLQGEMNIVRPFTYSHGSSLQSWGHMYQPLAHPLGANFGEVFQSVSYASSKGWGVVVKAMYARFGTDKDMDQDGAVDNMGGNIFRSYKAPFKDFGNEMFQGNSNAVLQFQTTLSYPLDRLFGSEIFITHWWRENKSDFAPVRDHWIMLGIRLKGTMRPNWFF